MLKLQVSLSFPLLPSLPFQKIWIAIFVLFFKARGSFEALLTSSFTSWFVLFLGNNYEEDSKV